MTDSASHAHFFLLRLTSLPSWKFRPSSTVRLRNTGSLATSLCNAPWDRHISHTEQEKQTLSDDKVTKNETTTAGCYASWRHEKKSNIYHSLKKCYFNEITLWRSLKHNKWLIVYWTWDRDIHHTSLPSMLIDVVVICIVCYFPFLPVRKLSTVFCNFAPWSSTALQVFKHSC